MRPLTCACRPGMLFGAGALPHGAKGKTMKLFEAIDARHEEIARFRPFSDGNLQEQIRAFSRLEVTCSSNAIEGSSCTLSETKVLLEDGLTAGGKPLAHALAAEGHARAWDYMFSLLHADAVSEENLLFMHGLLQGLEIHAVPICYRKAPVFVTGSRHVPPDFRLVPGAMKRLVEGQGRLFAKCHPVAAAKFHKELAFIHPFADGNGRIARLAMNCLLVQRGFLPVSIPPVLRQIYIESLERAHVSDADFIALVARAEYETQKDFLRMLKESGARPHGADAPAGPEEGPASWTPESGPESRMPER